MAKHRKQEKIAWVTTVPGGKVGSKTVRWMWSRFGWDAVLYNLRGRSVNAINYGLQHEPTAEDKAEARAAFAYRGK